MELLESRLVLSALHLTPIGTYASGVFDDSAAETVTHDADTQRLYVTNASADVDETVDGQGGVDVLDIRDPINPTLLTTIDTSAFGASPTSTDTYGGLLAVAVANEVVTDNGRVAFFDVRGETPELVGSVEVGALPDAVIFTPDGRKLLVANEGEPNDDYTIDPEGSISIINTENLLADGIDAASVQHATFTRFNRSLSQLSRQGVRIFGPGATVAQDLEPEYIAVNPINSRVAYVTLQENNAVAAVNIDSAQVMWIKPLGFKDHSADNNGLDASDKDKKINIQNWPVRGMYQPDGIASYVANGAVFFVTANEGDARDYDGFSEEVRVADLNLGPAFGTAEEIDELQGKKDLGRLKTTNLPPSGKTFVDGKLALNQIFSYGARSFSIWSGSATQIYDSGDDFERITAEALPDDFGATDDENDSLDKRSDDKGPEPESVVIGEIDGRTYAFIGLERVGGVMVYDITDPQDVFFQSYVNNRDFSGDAEEGTAGDLAPEGLKFISAAASPTDSPLLVTANEVSGTTTIFEISFVEETADDAGELPDGANGEANEDRATGPIDHPGNGSTDSTATPENVVLPTFPVEGGQPISTDVIDSLLASGDWIPPELETTLGSLLG